MSNAELIGQALFDAFGNAAARFADIWGAEMQEADMAVAAAAYPELAAPSLAAPALAELNLLAAIEAEAATAAGLGAVQDCGATSRYPTAERSSDYVGIAAAAADDLAAEMQMQACQAADQGPPATPMVVPVYWTAGQICRGDTCIGGKYTEDLVSEQMDFVNRIYAHIGIRFSWWVKLPERCAAWMRGLPIEQEICMSTWCNASIILLIKVRLLAVLTLSE
jgi:hypothetical protein